MKTKMDKRIKPLFDKYIRSKFLYEGYVRLDKSLYKTIDEWNSENGLKLINEIYRYIASLYSSNQKCLCGIEDHFRKFFLKYVAENNTKNLEIKKIGESDYIFDHTRVKVYVVKSVSKYIKLLSKYKAEENLFFRGQSNSNFLLQPSIIREDIWRKNEKRMFDELERLCPKEFQGMNSILDKLVEMQHYNLPTRLLDVSSNALVALLFACQDFESDGEVIIFKEKRNKNPLAKMEETNIRYGHSDSVSLLTGISQMNYEDQLLLYYIAEFFRKLVKSDRPLESWFNKKDGTDKWDSEINLILEKVYKNKYTISNILCGNKIDARVDSSILQLNELKKEYESNAKKNSWALKNQIKNFNSIDVVKRLYRQVQREKPYFECRIVPQDVCNILFVKPSMLNQRIVKQSGAFIIVGAMEADKSDIVCRLNNYRYRKEDIAPIFIIPSIYKKRILNELKLCDLHTASIYPEIEKVAEYIKKTIE